LSKFLSAGTKLKIRKGTTDDSDIILDFIQKLAVYEKLSHECDATTDKIKESVFSPSSNVHTLLAFYDDQPVGFALYFYNYSTFKAKKGLYLEDLFVDEEMRGKGFGKKLLVELAKIAREENCGRFEWSVLDWNKPAIDFYKNIGAEAMDDWTVYRLEENGIDKLADTM
jgi:GNAT superfamily N-acetyltransferase